MRRGLRTFLTMSVLVAVFVGGTYTGVRLLLAEAPELPEVDTSSSCRNRTLERGEQLSPNQVRINVLNAGGRSGMANRTMLNLQTVGFMPGVIKNAPAELRIRNVRVVSRGRTRVDARLVGAQFKGKVQYTKGVPEDEANVEVYIGTDFEGMKKKPVNALKARDRVTLCVPAVGEPTPAA